MPEDKQQSSMLTMFGVIFTVIALVALIALVLVRSKATSYNESANVTQTTETQAVAPSIDADTIVIEQAGASSTDVGYYDGTRATYPSGGTFTSTPAAGINLTAGGLTSNIPQVRFHLTDNNSIPQAIINASAVIKVVVSNGATPTDDCANLDANHCVMFTYAGNATDPNRAGAAIVTPDTSSPTETGGVAIVATPLPYTFLKGRVNYVIIVTPVDANGAVQNGSGNSANLVNSNYDGNMWVSGKAAISYVYGLPAISVAGWNGSAYSGASITYYADGATTALTPNQASIGYGVEVTNLGNIQGRVQVSAQDASSSIAWVNSTAVGGPLYMPASITHFLGRADKATPVLSTASDYGLTGVEILGASGDAKVVTTAGGDNSSWLIPLSVTAALSNVTPATTLTVTPGTNIYDTEIKPTLGSVGTYSSTMINTVIDATDVNGAL